jgi:hypothetical protein
MQVHRFACHRLVEGFGCKQRFDANQGLPIEALWLWTATMQIGSGCTVHLQADELPN